MERAKKVIKQIFTEDNQTEDNQTIILVTHGNLMTLILRYFDEQYGFEEWKNLTNPDVYKITLDNKPKVERVWKG